MEDPEASGGHEAVPEEIRKVRAGGSRETEERAGGAREAEEIADNFTEGDEFPEENAAVLEKLEKNGAFAALAGEGGVANNSVEETREVRA